MARALSKAERPSPDAMTLLEHLAELRRRLIISVLAFTGGAIVCYLFYNPILSFLEKPYQIACRNQHHSCTGALSTLAPLQGFTTRLNVCAYGGLVIGLPIILWQLWKFVTPGLKANERRYALPFVCSTVVLFFLGGLTAYIIYPRGLTWLLQQSGPGVNSLVSIAELHRSHLPAHRDLRRCVRVPGRPRRPRARRGHQVRFPQTSASLRLSRHRHLLGRGDAGSDPFSMLALVVPLTVFYEGAIIVGRLLGK